MSPDDGSAATLHHVRGRSHGRFWPEADVIIAAIYVRFWEERGHAPVAVRCRLLIQSNYRKTPTLIPANVAYEYFNVTPDRDAQQIDGLDHSA